MTEELGNAIQNMFKSIYEAADVKYLRPIKRQMFKCGHDCLDDRRSVKEAERCIDDCGQTLHKAINIVQKETNAFQGRIDRCLIDCQDSVRNEKDESRAQAMFDSCGKKCIEKFSPTVAEVSKTICINLEKLKEDNKI